MKRRIYAISLLLSYLIVLGHQMISHHHHDHHHGMMADLSSIILEKADEHVHDHHHAHDEDTHEKNSDKTIAEQEHKHPFPVHQHIYTTDDIEYTRTYVSVSNLKIKSITSFFVSNIFLSEFIDPPDFTFISYGDPPFIKTSLFDPGANALRGPPSIV